MVGLPLPLTLSNKFKVHNVFFSNNVLLPIGSLSVNKLLKFKESEILQQKCYK